MDRERVRAFLGGHLGWIFYVLAGLATCITLWYGSLPGISFKGSVISLLAWLVVGGTWAARLLSFLVINRKAAWGRPLAPWAITPALVVVTFFVARSDALWRFRFELSRPALDRYAEEVERTGATPRESWIGLYPVQGSFVGKIEGGFRFAIDGAGALLESTGFAYSPEGPPRKESNVESYTHLEGPWYLWQSAFD